MKKTKYTYFTEGSPLYMQMYKNKLKNIRKRKQEKMQKMENASKLFVCTISAIAWAIILTRL